MIPASAAHNKKRKFGFVQPEKERDLVSRCQSKERQAQFELYQQYKDWVFNVAYRMAGHQQEAEDITQKVFIQIFAKIDLFRGDSALSSWIYRIASNICINHFHSEKKRRRRISNELSSREKTDDLESGAQEKKIDLKPHLEKAIRALPEGYRMVFTLYDIEGYSHKEIGQMMNVSEGTSKSQLHKARKELRQALEPYLLLQTTL